MLYTGVWGFICLVPRFHYCARPMRFGSRGPSEFSRPSRSSRVRHQNALTEKAWEGRRTGTRQGQARALFQWVHAEGPNISLLRGEGQARGG